MANANEQPTLDVQAGAAALDEDIRARIIGFGSVVA